MAIASSGGHWVQLRRLSAVFSGLDLICVGTDPGPAPVPGARRHYTVRNATRRNRLAFAVLTWQIMKILLRERPDVVITTGAAPGLVALACAKVLLRSRTIWIDSISSSETLTLSARLARPVADVRLVQWAHLARPEGPEYWGAVL